MGKADNHIHSKYSFDSKSHINDIMAEAKKKKLDYVTLADHVEFSNQPIGEVLHRIENRNNKIDDLSKNSKVTVLKGLEISEPNMYTEEIMELTNNLEIDSIIGSVHHVLGMPLRKMVTYKDLYNLYLRSVLEMVERADIDCLAHLDYVKRYLTNGSFDEMLLEEILNVIIDRGIALELNTSGIRRCKEPFPSYSIIDKYKSMGGTKILVGSDAHEISEIGNHFQDAEKAVSEIGLKEGVVIKRRFRNL